VKQQQIACGIEPASRRGAWAAAAVSATPAAPINPARSIKVPINMVLRARLRGRVAPKRREPITIDFIG
jgi:hypothetical protein